MALRMFCVHAQGRGACLRQCAWLLQLAALQLHRADLAVLAHREDCKRVLSALFHVAPTDPTTGKLQIGLSSWESSAFAAENLRRWVIGETAEGCLLLFDPAPADPEEGLDSSGSSLAEHVISASVASQGGDSS